MNEGSRLSLSSSAPPGWDEYRMQARRIERDVDAKLATLVDSGAQEQTLEEIEQLLRKLADTHDAMSRCAAAAGPGSGALLLTLQRHRELLHSYRNDVRAAKAAATTKREREELLGSVRVDIDSRSDALLRERQAIHGSERAAETVLKYAIPMVVLCVHAAREIVSRSLIVCDELRCWGWIVKRWQPGMRCWLSGTWCKARCPSCSTWAVRHPASI